MTAGAPTAAEVIAEVRAAINEITDPCSVTRGVPIGLVDMGLITGVTADALDGRWHVRVGLRFTSPACAFAPRLDEQITAAVGRLDVVLDGIAWSMEADWTPAAISATARARLARRREELLARRVELLERRS